MAIGGGRSGAEVGSGNGMVSLLLSALVLVTAVSMTSSSSAKEAEFGAVSLG
jgi:hypothetical protein